MENLKKYLVEMAGTCMLVFFGCGSAALLGTSGVGYLLTALAFGLTLGILVLCFGKISGCHVNPAVTLAMLLARKIGALESLGYIAAQLIGAIEGSALLYLIFRVSSVKDQTGALGANSATGLGGVWVALLVEAIITFAFVLTVLLASSKNLSPGTGAFASGAALTLAHIFGIGFTGASVNPARSVAPALFVRGDALRDVWIFVVAPIVGALLAALFVLFLEKGMKENKA